MLTDIKASTIPRTQPSFVGPRPSYAPSSSFSLPTSSIPNTQGPSGKSSCSDVNQLSSRSLALKSNSSDPFVSSGVINLVSPPSNKRLRIQESPSPNKRARHLTPPPT